MHFGLYLKRRGAITAEQLVRALELQVDDLVPIGQLALEEGILSAREIFAILRMQNELPRERFGDVAIELGLMTRDELMRLLMIQADRRRPLAEIFVQQGVLTQERMLTELEAFRHAKSQPHRVVVRTVERHRPRQPNIARGSTNGYVTM